MTTFADWDCTASASLENGDARVVRWLGPDGVLSSTVVLWTPKLKAQPELRVLVRWQALPPDKIDLERGLVMFDQTVVGIPKGQTRPRYILELRTRADGPWDGYGQISGDFVLADGVRLSADWADVKAMSRGADHLFLILKDRKGRTISIQALQPSMFVGIDTTIARMLEETAAMARKFRTRCQSNQSQDIII